MKLILPDFFWMKKLFLLYNNMEFKTFLRLNALLYCPYDLIFSGWESMSVSYEHTMGSLFYEIYNRVTCHRWCFLLIRPLGDIVKGLKELKTKRINVKFEKWSCLVTFYTIDPITLFSKTILTYLPLPFLPRCN